jgi:rRNA-processing protein FCF1
VDRRDDYIRWSLDAEVHLRSVLHRADAESFFDGPRHRDICSMAPGNQLTPLIEAELNHKVQDFNAAASYLESHARHMRRSSGLPIVIDSNVLLQCQRLDYVDWELLGLNESARVMVPLRVLEEIDARKYSDSKRLRAIARGLLPWIDALFPGGPGPMDLREGAIIELLLADRPRYRPSDADEEILDVCHDVLQFAGRVKLMTGDTGVRSRATSEGLEALRVPESWWRTTEDSNPA